MKVAAIAGTGLLGRQLFAILAGGVNNPIASPSAAGTSKRGRAAWRCLRARDASCRIAA